MSNKVNNDNEKRYNDISFFNRDVGHKYMTMLFESNALRVYGFNVPEVKQLCSTELPAVSANELRIDNLIEFMDGTYAIVDYECKYSTKDKYKYYNYVVRVATNYYNKYKKHIYIRMLVIYSADVKLENLVNEIDLGAAKLKVEPVVLKENDVEKTYEYFEQKVQSGIELTEEDKVRLVVLPLCAREKHERDDIIDKLIELIKCVKDRDTQSLLTKGLVTFTDKFIDERQRDRMKGLISMTWVDEMYYEKAMEMIEKAVAKNTEEVTKEVTNKLAIKTAKEMIKDGLSTEKIAMYCTDISAEEIDRLRETM